MNCLPFDIYRIVRENCIMADKKCIFGVCLDYQQAIERILVMAWEGIERKNMIQAYR